MCCSNFATQIFALKNFIIFKNVEIRTGLVPIKKQAFRGTGGKQQFPVCLVFHGQAYQIETALVNRKCNDMERVLFKAGILNFSGLSKSLISMVFDTNWNRPL